MRIRTLHREQSGMVASAELILALPIFLLFWVLMWDFGVLQSAKLALVIENRTTAFMQAYHQSCRMETNHQEAITNKTEFESSNCSETSWGGAGRFWNELDRAGSEGRLTRNVRAVPAPSILTTQTTARFSWHPEVEWSEYDIPDRFTVMQPLTYTSRESRAIAAGYDPELRRRFSSGHGSFVDLIPRVFRGSAR